MPIYEYEARDTEKACKRCRRPFEVIQALKDPPLERCPDCGAQLRKLVSRCRAAVMENDEAHMHTENRIREYEKQGLWSHAAELADTHAAEVKDRGTRLRAIDNYQKAGYPVETLEKHAKSKME